MKDNLFEMLLSLFEKSLTQLQKSHKTADQAVSSLSEEASLNEEGYVFYVKQPENTSTRVFTYEEQMKLTKASYQFLVQMNLLNILNPETFEAVIHQLQFSESRIVSLQETKWAIKNVLLNHLDEEQLAFLDLILYPKDELTVH